MPKKLKDLLINRVDLVDKGDNPEANITLFKRDDSDGGGDDVNSDIFLSASNSGVEKLFNVFKNLFYKEGVKDSMPKFDVKGFAKEHADEKLLDRVNKLSDDQVQKIASAMEAIDEDNRSSLVLGYEVDKREQEALIESLKKEEETEEEKARRLKMEEEEEEKRKANKSIPDDVLKSLSPEVRAIVEKSQQDAKEANELAKKLQMEKLEGEYIAKAKAFDAVVTQPDKVGPILKRIADVSKEDYEVIEAVLKAANEAVSKNNVIMKEFGASGEQGGGDVWTQIERKADDLMKSDNALTKETAIAKVMDSDPVLYKRYQEELYGEVQ